MRRRLGAEAIGLTHAPEFAGGPDWIGREEPCAVPQGKSSVRLSLSVPALAAQ